MEQAPASIAFFIFTSYNNNRNKLRVNIKRMKKIIAGLFILIFLFPASIRASVLQPNDPYFFKQWGLYNYGQVVDVKGDVTYKAWTSGVDINAKEAWGLAYINGRTNSQIIIAVIDTGVDYNHEDLKDRILRDSYGNIIGYDYVGNDADPMDMNGHGTMVASIAAATGNNGIGMSGVVWNAKIMPIRILDQEGTGEIEKIKTAIHFAADHGANIINLSIVSNAYDDSLTDSLNYAYNKGAVIIAAAGNDGFNLTDYPRSPVNNDGDRNIIIGVGAVNSADQKLNQSNFGQGVDISAPGTNLLAAEYDKVQKASEYVFVSGTSAATAVVSGSAALIKSFHPDWNNKKITDSILTSATPFTTDLKDMGAGRINLAKALGVETPVALRGQGYAIKSACGSTVYITLGNGAIVPLESPDVFLKLGYQWNEIVTVSDFEIAVYEKKLLLKSSWMPAAGSLVKGSGKTIYLVGGSRLSGFETLQAFCGRGYNLNQVLLISDAIINAYKKGSSIR